MRCPFCANEDTQVKDSRPTEESTAIRRRRYCPKCNSRFTTFERVYLRDLYVIKRNGERAVFDRDKLAQALMLACRKRPIETGQVEMVVSKIQRELEALNEAEVPSRLIGQMAMEELALLDKVAYVRFASVYRDFNDPKDFQEFVGTLQSTDT